MNHSLEQAISLLHSGQWQEAREILQGILQTERSNEAAWLWYSVSLETNEQRIRALEVCLRLNPNAGRVRAALEKLRKAGPGEEVFSLWAAPDENPYDPFPAFGSLSPDVSPFGSFPSAAIDKPEEDPFKSFRSSSEPEENPFGSFMTPGSEEADEDPFKAFRSQASVEPGENPFATPADDEDPFKAFRSSGEKGQEESPFGSFTSSGSEPEEDPFRAFRSAGGAEAEENPFGAFTSTGGDQPADSEGPIMDWGEWNPGSVFTDLPEDGGVNNITEEQQTAQPDEGIPDRTADDWSALREEKPKIKPLKVQEERRRQKILGEIPSDPLQSETRRSRKSQKKSGRNRVVLYAAIAAVGLLGIVILLAGMLIALGVVR